jgi:creatinine amidohydrolase
MNWENLTAPDFAEAVKTTGGVCVIPVGCVEKHFDHLPLGTDFLNGHKVCTLAAEKEPAVVFPPYYFGQIHEARPFPGTVAIDPILTLQLLMAACDEIGRNGFKKIVLYNAHGGNIHLLHYLCQSCLAERKPYAIYFPERLHPEERRKAWKEILETETHGHACECETSISLANHAELVKMSYVRDRKTEPLGRYAHIPPGRIASRWYSDYPDHYAGDATAATAEKGEKLRQLQVDSLADFIRAVREDNVVPTLLNEFYDRCDQVGT